MKRLQMWLKRLLTALVQGFQKRPRREIKPSEVALTSNSAVTPSIYNRIRDIFNKPARFAPKNNRRWTPGRRFHFVKGKKIY